MEHLWWMHLTASRKSRIRDLRPGSQLIGRTWDPRPRTLKVGPKTRHQRPTQRWNTGPETQDPERGTQDPGPETQKVNFKQIFSVFFETWLSRMNSFALCVFVYFVCYSLPYGKVYTLLIFYHLNEFIFPSFFPCICYEIFKLPTKRVIIVRSHI